MWGRRDVGEKAPLVILLGAVVFQLKLPGIAFERIAVRLVLEFYVALALIRPNVYVHT